MDKIPRPYLVEGINPWVDTVDPPLDIPGEHQRTRNSPRSDLSRCRFIKPLFSVLMTR